MGVVLLALLVTACGSGPPPAPPAAAAPEAPLDLSGVYFDDGKAVYSVDYRQLGPPVKEADLVPSGSSDQHVEDGWVDPQGKVLTWRDVRRAGDGLAYLTGSPGAIARPALGQLPPAGTVSERQLVGWA